MELNLGQRIFAFPYEITSSSDLCYIVLVIFEETVVLSFLTTFESGVHSEKVCVWTNAVVSNRKALGSRIVWWVLGGAYLF